jgi:hypothetical protein
VSAEQAKFAKQQWLETIKYPWTTYKDPDIRRQFKKHSVLGYAALDADKHEKVKTVRNLYIITKVKFKVLTAVRAQYSVF